MKNPDITVVIPVYNTERFVGDCLKSIKMQSFQNFECIVINDGSTDNSLAVCRKVIDNDYRFKIIDKENEGVSLTRNKGIQIAQAPYIIFIDSDDTIEANMLEELFKGITSTEADIAICPMTYISQNSSANKKVCGLKSVLQKNEFLQFIVKYGSIPYIGGNCNKLYKLIAIKNLGIIFEKGKIFAEDFMFNIKYFACVNTAAIVDSTSYNYKVSVPGSLSKKQNDLKQDFLRIEEVYNIWQNLFSAGCSNNYIILFYELLFNRCLLHIQTHKSAYERFSEVFEDVCSCDVIKIRQDFKKRHLQCFKSLIQRHSKRICYLYLCFFALLLRIYNKLRYQK